MILKRISLAAVAGLVLLGGLAAPAGAQMMPRQVLLPPPNNWMQFGFVIDASADTVVVGAPDSIRNNDASNCSLALAGFGAVAVYTKSGNDWVLSQQLWHDPYAATDTLDWEPRFGESLSLRGNTLAVNAPRLNVNGVAGVGGFYVFQRTSPSAAFSRVGPIFSPTAPSTNARLGDISGIATNGTYVAIGDRASGTVLYYVIQGATVTYVASTPTLDGPPERLFITDNNVLVALINGYPRLLAYQLGPSSLTAIDTSSLVDGSLYTHGSGGDGNTFVSGLNHDPTLYRAVTFSASAITSIKTITVPVPSTATSPSTTALAVKEGSGAYVSLADTNIVDGYIGGILAGNFTSVSTVWPSTIGVTGPKGVGQPLAFNGTELFASDYSSGLGGSCATNFPSTGKVTQLLAGGLGIAGLMGTPPVLP